MKTNSLFFAFLSLIFTHLLVAQSIHIRTVPVIASNQSEFHPSLARGMGNLSIAFDDPLADPLVNPAKASLLQGVNLFSAPTRNSWSNEDGRSVFTTRGSSKYPGAAINSIPFGGFFQKGTFFGGGLLAHQGYTAERSSASTVSPWGGTSGWIRRDIGSNTYALALFGMRFPNSDVSVAGSFSWAQYGAMDGVNLLYPGSSDIKQYGRTLEYKVGVIAELAERDRLEFVAARNLFRARHEVTFEIFSGPVPSFLTETNLDESNGWIMHAGYTRSVNDEWKIGAIVTVDWKDHPKIPNYSLANIPRDPGNSIAYNVGIGAVQYGERSTWGLEYVYEPITSNTWAEAGEVLDSPLPADFKTIENFFDFSNHILRIGAQSETHHDWLQYRLGAQIHYYRYDLNQVDNVLSTSRFQRERWFETTLSGGLNVEFSNVQLMYTLQLILGNGMVGTEAGFGRTDAVAPSSDFLVAPSGKLVVDGIPLLTQQLVFVYRLE
ncbi:MAG: hypothetical protein ACE5H0_07785 [Bacteroidota bacterium]